MGLDPQLGGDKALREFSGNEPRLSNHPEMIEAYKLALRAAAMASMNWPGTFKNEGFEDLVEYMVQYLRDANQAGLSPLAKDHTLRLSKKSDGGIIIGVNPVFT